MLHGMNNIKMATPVFRWVVINLHGHFLSQIVWRKKTELCTCLSKTGYVHFIILEVAYKLLWSCNDGLYTEVVLNTIRGYTDASIVAESHYVIFICRVPRQGSCILKFFEVISENYMQLD